MNKSIILLLLMIFSFLFGDANVVVRHGDQQVAQGEFIGTYMNHVHILMGDKIIYYACDDIVSITSSSAGFSYGNEFDYDCSKNTVTADILFPPQLDPMTGEMTNMLPDVFNKDLFYLSSKKNTLIAGTLSFFTKISGFGHLYASGWEVKVWLRSIPYSLAFFYFVLQAEKERVEQRPEYDIYGDPFEPPRHLLIAVYAAYIGLIYDSVYMTRKYNIKLHNEIYDYEIKKVSELKQFESELKLRQAL